MTNQFVVQIIVTMIGYLLIDKPAGITSHDVVNHIRRATGERRVGHAGTLDPLATQQNGWENWWGLIKNMRLSLCLER